MTIRISWRVIVASVLVLFALSACQDSGPEPTQTSTASPSAVGSVTPATPTLIPASSDSPAAGICATFNGDWAVAEIHIDTPSPRCLELLPRQRLRVANRTTAAIRVELGPYKLDLQPGAEDGIDMPLGNFLAMGVHVLHVTPYSGPELWLVTTLPHSLPHAFAF